MKALSYLIATSLKNQLRLLLRKPALLIVYSLLLGLIAFAMLAGGGTGSGAAGDFLPRLRITAFAFFAFITYLNFSKGLKQGSTFFSMADVNMLFTSPVRPQSVLLYGVIRQMGTSALATFFLLFQIPNMRNLLQLDGRGIFAVLSGWFVLLACMQIVSLCVYSLTAPHQKRRKTGNAVLYGFVAAFVAGLLMYLAVNRGEISAALGYFGLPFVQFVPFAGWMTAYVTGIAEGEYLTAMLFLLATVLFPAMGLLLVRRTDADYYEDVLQTTEQTFLFRQAAKEGRGAAVKNSMARVRTGRSGIVGRGKGASAFFYRHLTEIRRTGFFLLDKGSFVVIAISAGAGLIFRNLTEKGDFTPFIASIVAFCVLGYVQFFLTVSGKFTGELTKPFLFLVPAPNILKLFYANLATVIKSLAEGLVAFAVVSILSGIPAWYVPLAAILYASLAQLFISMSILTERILGGANSKILQTVLYLLSGGILLAPGIAIFGILQAVFYFGNNAFLFVPYLAAAVYNIAVSTLVLFLGQGILDTVDR